MPLHPLICTLCLTFGYALLAAEPTGRDGLESAAASHRAGDFAAAEAAYRRAWLDPRDRPAAAAALRALYDHRRLEPAVDEAALAGARSELGPSFVLTETRNFVILSDADQAWTRQRGALLERARHQYFRVMDRMEAPVYPHEHKLLCILFADFARYRAYSVAAGPAWNEWVAGYYNPVSNRIIFYDDRTAPDFAAATGSLADASRRVAELRDQARAAQRDGQTQYAQALRASADDLESRIGGETSRLTEQTRATSVAKAVHEAIHLLAFNTGLQRRDRAAPFWLSEGLATSFETDDAGGAFGPDRIGGRRSTPPASDLSLELLISLEQVPESASGDPAALARDMYALSRDLFSHLFRYRRKELAAYFQAVLAERPGPVSAEKWQTLFREAFGEPQALERRLKRN